MPFSESFSATGLPCRKRPNAVEQGAGPHDLALYEKQRGATKSTYWCEAPGPALSYTRHIA